MQSRAILRLAPLGRPALCLATKRLLTVKAAGEAYGGFKPPHVSKWHVIGGVGAGATMVKPLGNQGCWDMMICEREMERVEKVGMQDNVLLQGLEHPWDAHGEHGEHHE